MVKTYTSENDPVNLRHQSSTYAQSGCRSLVWRYEQPVDRVTNNDG